MLKTNKFPTMSEEEVGTALMVLPKLLRENKRPLLSEPNIGRDGISAFGYCEIEGSTITPVADCRQQVCHATMTYWGEKDIDRYDWVGDRKTTFDSTKKYFMWSATHDFPEWISLLSGRDTPYMPLMPYLISDTKYIRKHGLYIFKDLCHIPQQLLFNFMVATRQPWDRIEHEVGAFNEKFVELSSLMHPRLAAFVAMHFTKNGAAWSQRMGDAHAVMDFPSEQGLKRWWKQDPAVTQYRYGIETRHQECAKNSWRDTSVERMKEKYFASIQDLLFNLGAYVK